LATARFKTQSPQKQLEALRAFPESVSVDKNGMLDVSGLKIRSEYIKDHHAIDATRHAKPYSAIVAHYTGVPTFAKSILGLRGKDHIGYHFYIDQDGIVAQAIPLDKRSNNVQSSSLGPPRSARSQINNDNSISISFVGVNNRPTIEQMESAKKLAAALIYQYRIPLENIVGHGEIQAGKAVLTESARLAKKMKVWRL
jgi:N-acetyl-anhydromuramyl-L-alanine amidase AmpD